MRLKIPSAPQASCNQLRRIEETQAIELFVMDIPRIQLSQSETSYLCSKNRRVSRRLLLIFNQNLLKVLNTSSVTADVQSISAFLVEMAASAPAASGWIVPRLQARVLAMPAVANSPKLQAMMKHEAGPFTSSFRAASLDVHAFEPRQLSITSISSC